MEPTFEKVDETTIKITKEVIEQKETNYTIDELKNQEIAILKQMNDFVEARKVELQEVRDLIAKCEELGVKSALEVEITKESLIDVTTK